MNGVLSYKDWLTSASGNSKLADPYQSYLAYVNDWYEASYNGKGTDELTADEYRSFLLTLKNVSTDPEILTYVNNLDYTDLDQVQTAIPYFAKNLRLIANRISKNREDAKTTNDVYDYANSNKGLELEVYKSVLSLYASTNSVSGDEFLDAVKATSISIEELFDDDEYLDKDPSLLATDYFTTTDTATLLELDNTYLNWAIQSGFNDLYSNNDSFNPETSATLPLSGYLDYELSGTSVDYYKGNLSDALMGEAHYSLSGTDFAESVVDYSSASVPWNNLSNRYFPTIATIPLADSVYNVEDVGGFFIPSKLGMPVALGRNKFFNITGISLSGNKLDHFPDGSTYTDGYTFTKTFQDSLKPFNSYLNWIDIKQVRGQSKGILAEDGRHQGMIPYQTSYESTHVPYLGMDRVGDKTDPWYLSEDKVWENTSDFPPDFRKIYNVADWYSSTTIDISGYLDQWGIDIYGNNYALYKNTNSDNIYARMQNATGKLYIRSVDGTIAKYTEYFDSSLSGDSLSAFEFDSLKSVDVYNDLIVMEDINYQVTIQKIQLDGTYSIDPNSTISTVNNETAGEYRALGHYFDDRDQSLYLGRYAVSMAGVLDFIIYRYKDNKLVSVYDTTEDASVEMTALKSNYPFTNITEFPSMCISTLDNKLYVTYIAHISGGAKYFVSIPLFMNGNFEIDEITVVSPETPTSPTYTIRSTESIKLLNTTISENNLILLLEGQWTDGKYLQVIPL